MRLSLHDPLAVAAALLAVAFPAAMAYPTDDGEGSSFLFGSMHINDGKGSLADGGFKLDLGGIELSPDQTFTVKPGEERLASVSGTKTFKGFLVTVAGKDDQDLKGSIALTSDANPIAIPSGQVLESTGEKTGRPATCHEKKSGMTHADSNDKDAVRFILAPPVAGEAWIDKKSLPSKLPKTHHG
eukprot:CAMPEP_0183304768 /NCGR_PEP_ID=MMETSP0160_2-20130417/9748_1 /TAXON_ID=2839 ORGANISM="Odontella Sinensis, Strain Grunow 1884" /NCGR_SAMPLE_ID=MMETSP0160_2 /ASSEMBLY_ACC=CAM_ASM_000250 /LENGTH=184 /DNA_ID=CAMNT_0025467879 /DNA_START=111 /DNA_END=666 /DNA_ORIENTATION=+